MRITLLQQDALWADAEANLLGAEQALLSAPASDLYVLPEMFATGFCTEPQAIAEPADSGSTLRWMLGMASRTGGAVAASIAVRLADGAYRNRLYFARPDGTYASYDKRHLFAYGGESLHYTPGTSRTIVQWRGERILLQLCYDLRFPVFARNARPDDPSNLYDIALYPAAWPASRAHAFSTLLQARAIENQCYVCGVNRAGADPQCAYAGLSAFVDPKGRATRLGTAPGALTCETNPAALASFRRKFPVLADRD